MEPSLLANVLMLNLEVTYGFSLKSSHLHFSDGGTAAQADKLLVQGHTAGHWEAP